MTNADGCIGGATNRAPNGPRCGVKVEAIPWAIGKHRLTDAYNGKARVIPKGHTDFAPIR